MVQPTTQPIFWPILYLCCSNNLGNFITDRVHQDASESSNYRRSKKTVNEVYTGLSNYKPQKRAIIFQMIQISNNSNCQKPSTRWSKLCKLYILPCKSLIQFLAAAAAERTRISIDIMQLIGNIKHCDRMQ